MAELKSIGCHYTAFPETVEAEKNVWKFRKQIAEKFIAALHYGLAFETKAFQEDKKTLEAMQRQIVARGAAGGAPP